MRRKKYTLFNFCTGDFKGVEQYLNRQAAKGWKLNKVGVLLGRFIWAERDDLRWCVDLADPKREREEEEDYLGLCAEGGWDLAAKTNNMYLFCSRPACGPHQSRPTRSWTGRTTISIISSQPYYLFSSLPGCWRCGPCWPGPWQRLWHAGGYGEGGPVWLDGELDDPGGSGGPWPVVGVGGVASGRLSRRPGPQPERLRPPRPWTMWVSAVVSSVMVLAWGVVVLGAAGDALLTGEGNTWYLPFCWGAGACSPCTAGCRWIRTCFPGNAG